MTNLISRRKRWALLAVSGCAALALIFLLRKAATDDVSPSVRTMSDTTRPTATHQGFPPATLDPRADLSSSPDHIEICGVGWVRKGPPAEAIHKAAEAAATAALAAAAEASIAKGTPAQRAAAMYALRADVWMRTLMEQNPLERCGQDSSCMKEVRQRAHDAVQRLPQSLISDGLATIDPKVYALAFHACSTDLQGKSKEAECAKYSASRWAQLDPANAMAWLHVASAAYARGDAAAVEDALRRASKATYSDQHVSGLVALLDQAVVQGLDPSTRLSLTLRLSVLTLSAPVPNFHPPVEACSRAATRDASRRQMCSDLALVFTERSPDLMTFSVGMTLGERAGWPAEKVAALRDRKDAISQVLADFPANVESCEGMLQIQTRMEGMLREGELAGSQRRIGKSGRTNAELAREWRAQNPSRPL